ncbi:integrase [Aminobacter anthyllidis]|uniref:DUF6538 domain-containing protein n=1 Tax=Aminobacter anthyllidis TaxID=1035067 RepID=UPI002457E447|nr:DUF6538 domain-containing protein [Aminobacter anthyllidis]MDH4984837.1 integrase [Aminobacter anthyllidis]
MRLVLKHVIRTKAGTWHYRRRLPKDVAEAVGKGEFKRLLGATEREAVNNFPKANAEFERLAAEVRSRAARVRQGLTSLDVHYEAERRAGELAQGAVFVGGRSVPAGDTGGGPDDVSAADLVRDSYLSRFKVDPETGDPVGVDVVEARALNMLANGGAVARPAPTIEDARRLYVRERITGDTNEETKLARISRMMDHLSGGDVGKDRTLESLTREDARNVRDHLLRDLGIRPTTVRRYLNDIRAVINHGLVEFDMKDKLNPFLNLQIRNEAAAVDERHPINDKLLGPIRERIRDRAASDLWRIWRIVEHTGCRLGEVTGLLVADLRLDEPYPHVSLVPHPHRRLKNAGSARLVPLVGEVLICAES